MSVARMSSVCWLPFDQYTTWYIGSICVPFFRPWPTGNSRELPVTMAESLVLEQCDSEYDDETGHVDEQRY